MAEADPSFLSPERVAQVKIEDDDDIADELETIELVDRLLERKNDAHRTLRKHRGGCGC